MAKQDVIAAGVAAIQTAEAQAISDQLGIAYDAGCTDQKASDGTFKQSDIDAAVAAAQAVDAQAAADAKAASDGALASLQANMAALSAKEGQEAGVIAGLQSSVQAVQASLAAIVALLPQPVVPAPVADPGLPMAADPVLPVSGAQ